MNDSAFGGLVGIPGNGKAYQNASMLSAENAAQCQAADVSPIASAFQRIDSRTQQLEQLVAVLEQKIAPVLRATNPTKSQEGGNPKGNQSGMTEALMAHASYLERVIGNLALVIDRIEL